MDELEWWHADRNNRARMLAFEIATLANRARRSNFDIVAHILELASAELAKEMKDNF